MNEVTLSNGTGVQVIDDNDVFNTEVTAVIAQSDKKYAWLKLAQNGKGGQPEGTFYNSLTGKNYGKDINVTFLTFFHAFQEKTLTGGVANTGEFVRNITLKEFEQFEKSGYVKWDTTTSKYMTTNGTKVDQTWNFFLGLPDDPEAGVVRFAVGPGSKSEVNGWLSMIDFTRQIRVDDRGNVSNDPNVGVLRKIGQFAIVWKISAVLKQKDGGNSFYTIGDKGRPSVKAIGVCSPEHAKTMKPLFEIMQSPDIKDEAVQTDETY
jgi:hypothetical protein